MKSMINAIIYHGENTLVLELPHSIYDIYEKLMSIGYAGGPNQVKLTDDEGDALRVKLYGRIEMGNHLSSETLRMAMTIPLPWEAPSSVTTPGRLRTPLKRIGV